MKTINPALLLDEKKRWKIELFENFKQIFEKKIRPWVKIKKISETSITFDVKKSCLAHELRMDQDEILYKINLLLKNQKINRLEFSASLSDKKKNNTLDRQKNKKQSSHAGISKIEKITMSKEEKKALLKLNKKKLAKYFKQYLVRCKLLDRKNSDAKIKSYKKMDYNQ